MAETDLIDRQAAIDKFEPWLKVEGCSEGELNMLKAVLYELRFMPSAHQEIIRCKDCKDYQEGFDIDEKPFSRCNGSIRTYGQTSPNWYCADAERRTDGSD